VRLRFASENSRKNGPCGDDPMHGSSNKDGSELENENEDENGSSSCSCHHPSVSTHGLYIGFWC